MKTNKKYIEVLNYLLLAVSGLLIVYIGSKFQHITIPNRSQLLISNFFRYNLTLPMQLVYISIGFILGYFSRLNALLVGIALFLFFPLGTFIEALFLDHGDTSFGLLPFVLGLEFAFAIPTIFAGYLGRYISEISVVRKEGGSVFQEIKTRYPYLITCFSFGLLGVLIISICSLFHFHFNNLLQYETKTGRGAFFFYANYSNPAIFIFAMIGLLIGYKFRPNPFLAGLNLYLIFPISTIFSVFFNLLPLKEGLFMEWTPFLFPTMIMVLIGRFFSRTKRRTEGASGNNQSSIA